MSKIKSLQKVGTSKGVIIDKAILELLNLDHEAAAVARAALLSSLKLE